MVLRGIEPRLPPSQGGVLAIGLQDPVRNLQFLDILTSLKFVLRADEQKVPLCIPLKGIKNPPSKNKSEEPLILFSLKIYKYTVS